jgi:hypothetical protein
MLSSQKVNSLALAVGSGTSTVFVYGHLKNNKKREVRTTINVKEKKDFEVSTWGVDPE